MFQSKPQLQASKSVIHFQIIDDEVELSFAQVIDLWQHLASFRLFFNNILMDAPFPAFFWEVVPINKEELKKTFEFVLVNSSILPQVVADPQAFQEHFHSNQLVVDFWNLGKDARLIVPTPVAETSCYPHLAQFVRNAPTEQIDALWQRIGEVYAASLSE